MIGVSFIEMSIIGDTFYRSCLLKELFLIGNYYFRGVSYRRCLLYVFYDRGCLLEEVSIKGGVYYRGN